MEIKKDLTASDVPTFKVARVGKDRKRRGAGFSFLRSGGPRGVWIGAAGASRSGDAINALGMSFSKAMLAIMVTAGLGSSAVYIGAWNSSRVEPAGKPAIFAHDENYVKLDGDASDLPSNDNAIPNSLGYIFGGKDGPTSEERAKKAAVEAQRVADDEAAAKAEAGTAYGAPAANPAALLASAQADGGKDVKGGTFAKKLGALSAILGGGSSLSGGAGLSGGVARSFGSSGSPGPGGGGKLSAVKGQSRAAFAGAARSAVGASKVKGFARRQLANANALSRSGSTAGKAETAADNAASAFDNNPGAGNVISGPGLGQGAGSSNGADGTPNPGGGGPTGSASGDCASGSFMNADGACQAVKTAAATDAFTMLTTLSAIATGLLALIGVLAAIALMTGETGPVTGAMATVIAVLGGVVSALGVAIIAMGDYFSGTVFTTVGAAIALFSGSWAFGPLTAGQTMVGAFAGAMVGQAAKMLDPKKNPVPEAAQ